MIGKPYDTVYKITALPRWQREWINDRRQTVNYSGLVQDLLCEIIENNDPEYYEKNKKYLTVRITRKKETNERLTS